MHLVCFYSLCNEFERQRERGRDIENMDPPIHCPNAYNSPGALNSIHVSHIDDRDPSAWLIFLCPPRLVDGKLDWKQSSWGLKPHSDVKCG